MIEVKAPNNYDTHCHLPSIFLAGSIEMGVAEDWQTELVTILSDEDLLVLNPRRQVWDASWVQDISNQPFREQVEWELDAIDAADYVIFYFAPTTKAPITLLELGIQAGSHPEKLIVCCPEGFWRKGNVDIVCARYNVRQVATKAEIASAVKDLLKTKKIKQA